MAHEPGSVLHNAGQRFSADHPAFLPGHRVGGGPQRQRESGESAHCHETDGGRPQGYTAFPWAASEAGPLVREPEPREGTALGPWDGLPGAGPATGPVLRRHHWQRVRLPASGWGLPIRTLAITLTLGPAQISFLWLLTSPGKGKRWISGAP